MRRLFRSSFREGALGQDWTKGSVLHNLFRLSWPLLISEGAWAVTQFVEVVWVGKLGVVSLAGVGVSGFVFMLAMSGNMGLIEGVKAMVARFVGADDFEGANRVIQQALIVSTIYSLVVMVMGVFLVKPVMGLFGLKADVIAEGTAYLRLILVGWLPLSYFLIGYYVMQASGNTVTPMWITVLYCLFQVVLTPFLVFGWGVFPRLGVSGAALSLVISFGLGAVLLMRALFSRQSRLKLTLSNLRFDFNIIWRIVKIGIPAGVMRLQRPMSELVFARLMAPFGTPAVAAHSLVRRVEQMLTLPGTALGASAGVLVGLNLGARQPERARRSGWLAVGLVESFVVLASLGVLFWAENVFSLFSIEPDLMEIGSAFLRIAVLGFIATGVTLTLVQCLAGAGDTLPAMLFSLIDLWVIRLPLAFVLPRVANLGMYGVRWAIVIGMTVGATAYALYFRRGMWQRKRV